MWLNQTLPFSPMDSSFHTIRYIIFKNMYSIAPKNWYFINMVCLERDFNTNCRLAFKISIKTFSIRFFMHGTLQKGLKYENVKWSSGSVCSLQFKFEWQEGLTAVGDLQEVLLPITIIFYCSALHLKAQSSFLHHPLMC